MRVRARPAMLTMFLVAGGCGSDIGPGPLEQGTWGGVGASLEVAADGASVEFDCAHGRIAVPLVLDGDGRFDVPGTLVREGGPTPFPEPAGDPAHYRGAVDGTVLRLDVRLDTGAEVGSYLLQLGRRGELRRCL